MVINNLVLSGFLYDSPSFTFLCDRVLWVYLSGFNELSGAKGLRVQLSAVVLLRSADQSARSAEALEELVEEPVEPVDKAEL